MEPDGGLPVDRRFAAVDAMPETAEIEGLVRALVGMVRGGGISELDLAFGPVSIRLRGSAPGPSATPVPVAVVPPPVDVAAADPAPEAVISAPMIGTFYAALAPGEPPFVEVGDTIEVGQTVGIIEAMKIMNEIAADRGGVVAAVLVGNGQPVEYGSPLIRLRAAGDAPA